MRASSLLSSRRVQPSSHPGVVCLVGDPGVRAPEGVVDSPERDSPGALLTSASEQPSRGRHSRLPCSASVRVLARLAVVDDLSALAPDGVVFVHKEVVSVRKHSRYAAAES